MIIVPITQEIEVSADQFRKKAGTPQLPKFSLLDIIEFVGDYSKPNAAVITGMEVRAGGWFYHAKVINRHSVSSALISEKDVLRLLDSYSGTKNTGEHV